MARTAMRKRTRRTKLTPRSLAAVKIVSDEIAKDKSGAAAKGYKPMPVSVDGSYTGRLIYAQSVGDVILDGGDMNEVMVEVEIFFEEQSHYPDTPSIFKVTRQRTNAHRRETYPRERVDHLHELRGDELEIFAHAMTEAVRLGKERGILPSLPLSGGAK